MNQPMRKIDYLELCGFVSQKQAFVIRWLDRYERMMNLYWGQIRVIDEQLARIWGDEYELPPDEATQVALLEIDRKDAQKKRQRCRDRHSALIRYGQYFSQLPFRLLRNQPIPDCFWYVPETTNSTQSNESYGSQDH